MKKKESSNKILIAIDIPSYLGRCIRLEWQTVMGAQPAPCWKIEKKKKKKLNNDNNKNSTRAACVTNNSKSTLSARMEKVIGVQSVEGNSSWLDILNRRCRSLLAVRLPISSTPKQTRWNNTHTVSQLLEHSVTE